jgi:hypothetical protein
MKKIILLLSLLSFAVQANDYEKVGVEVVAENLNGDAYYVPGLSGSATEYEGFISNAGFVVTTEGVVVLDALGTPSLAKAMLNEIRKITDKPIIMPTIFTVCKYLKSRVHRFGRPKVLGII